MTGLAPGYCRQRFTVSLSYKADRYEGPFTADEIASALEENLDEGVAVTVTTDPAPDESA